MTDVSLTFMSVCLSLSLLSPPPLSLSLKKKGGGGIVPSSCTTLKWHLRWKTCSEPKIKISFKYQYTTMYYCIVFNHHSVFLRVPLLCKVRKHCTLFHLELYQQLFTFSEDHILNSNVTYSFWITTTAQLYQSAFVVITFLVFIHMSINFIVFLYSIYRLKLRILLCYFPFILHLEHYIFFLS